MDEKIEKVAEGHRAIGRKCPHCQKPFQVGDPIVECPRCHSVHHVDCWKTKGGCAKTGCPQIAKTVVGEKPQGDGPPPPVPRKYILGGIGLALILILTMFFWPKPPDPALGRTKITFMGEGAIDEQNTMQSLAEQFNAANSDIYLDMQVLPYGGMEMKLIVLMAAGEAPDIFTFPQERLESYIERGMLLNLAEEGQEPLYAKQHPGQLTKIGVFGNTPHPEAALEVFQFLLDNIPAVDLDLLREQGENNPLSPPGFGF